MARSGQIQQKVSEEQLVQLLDQISQQESKSTQPKILYTKRRSDDEDDEDDFKKPASGAAADDSEDDFFD
jgi:programmed cell death protein 5